MTDEQLRPQTLSDFFPESQVSVWQFRAEAQALMESGGLVRLLRWPLHWVLGSFQIGKASMTVQGTMGAG